VAGPWFFNICYLGFSISVACIMHADGKKFVTGGIRGQFYQCVS
jgi:hypothetical protein